MATLRKRGYKPETKLKSKNFWMNRKVHTAEVLSSLD